MQHTLKTQQAFRHVYLHGKKWVTPSFIVYFYNNPNCATFQYGLTASRKVGNAVLRNKAKRKLRAALHLYNKQGLVKKGDTYLFIATAKTPQFKTAEIVQHLNWAIHRLKKKHA